MASTSFSQSFSDLINAGFPYIYIPTYEEARLTATIQRILRGDLIKTSRKLYFWTRTDGMVSSDGEKIARTTEPVDALNSIVRGDEPAIYLFKDFHIYLSGERNARPDHTVIRKLRDIISALQSERKTIVFVSANLAIPCEMEKEISILDFDLPTVEEITELIDRLTEGMSPDRRSLTDDEKTTLARSALGLTMQEAENAFCRAIVKQKGLSVDAISVIHEEKNQVVKKTGVLEFVESELDISDIGGLENMKKWLLKRNDSWSERAKAYNLPAPKGILITGVPGCGKSLTAKAMSAIWGLPLLKLDMGKIFGGIVGSSEENMRKAIATAEAVSPSILWVDEIEKGFTGIKSGGDSGTSARVFGTFLTWMQEKTKAVFVIATANDISALPPELLRKGRFDEIFFVDLPTTKEREKIFDLHIKKRTRSSAVRHEVEATPEVCRQLAEMSEGYVGAEIEQIVIAALYEAFYQNRGLTFSDIEKAIKETVPLSTTQKEQIIALREWAKERAVLATSNEDREPEGSDPGAEGAASFSREQGGRILDFDI